MLIEDIQEVRREVRDCLVSSFYVPDTLGDSTSLMRNGVVDSVAELVEFLESNFGVHVEDREVRLENLDSIARIAAFLCRKKAESTQAVEEAGDLAIDDVGMSDGSHVSDAVELDHLHPG